MKNAFWRSLPALRSARATARPALAIALLERDDATDHRDDQGRSGSVAQPGLTSARSKPNGRLLRRWSITVQN